MLEIILYIVFISLTGIVAFFIYLDHLLHKAFFVKPVLCEKSPADYAIEYEQIFIPTENEKRLELWDINPHLEGTVIIGIHGWELAADSLLPTVKPLLKKHRVILINARNHGQSDPEKYSTVINYQEDIEAVIAHVREQSGSESPIILLGHSLGGAAAFLAASRNKQIDGLISIATFADMETIMTHTISARSTPKWFVASMLAYIEFRLGEKMEKVSPAYLVKKLTIPVLIIHGEQDEMIPVDSLEKIVAAGNNENVQSLVLKGQGHSSLLESAQISNGIIDFLEKVEKNLPVSQ